MNDRRWESEKKGNDPRFAIIFATLIKTPFRLLRKLNWIRFFPRKKNEQTKGRGPASDSNGEWMRRQKRRFDERNRRIADVCQRRGVRTATPAVIRNFNESTVVATPGRSQGLNFSTFFRFFFQSQLVKPSETQ